MGTYGRSWVDPIYQSRSSIITAEHVEERKAMHNGFPDMGQLDLRIPPFPGLGFWEGCRKTECQRWVHLKLWNRWKMGPSSQHIQRKASQYPGCRLTVGGTSLPHSIGVPQIRTAGSMGDSVASQLILCIPSSIFVSLRIVQRHSVAAPGGGIVWTWNQ